MSRPSVFVRAGLAVVAVGYAVMGSALVQYLWARNMRRRMDFALSGGFAGVGLVVLGVAVVLCARAWQSVVEEEQAQRGFIASLDGPGVEAGDAAVAALPGVVLASANSFHRPDCLLLAGRTGLAELDVAAALDAGLSACKLCLKGVGVG